MDLHDRLPPSLPLLLAAALVAPLSACGPEAGIGTQTHVDFASGEGGGGARPGVLGDGALVTPLLALFDGDGALVVIEPEGGALVDRRELPPLGAPADLVLDAARGRLVVALEPEEGEGAIVSVPWDGAQLGPAERLAVVSGRARVAPLPEGLVVASDGDGPRARLLRDDGAPTRGLAVPPVRGFASEGGELVGLGLARGIEAERFALAVDDEGQLAFESRRALGVSPADAAFAPLPAAGAWVALRAADRSLSLLPLDASGAPEVGGARALAAAAGRLDGAVAWPVGSLSLAVAEPARVVVVSLSTGEERQIPLPAPCRSGGPYARRDLVALGASLWIATRRGVLRLTDAPDEQGEVSIDAPSWAEDLRGPLARVTSP